MTEIMHYDATTDSMKPLTKDLFDLYYEFTQKVALGADDEPELTLKEFMLRWKEQRKCLKNS